jgi:dihydrofolate reductase
VKLTVHTFVTLDGVIQGPGAPEEDPSGGFTRGGWMVPFAPDHWGKVVDSWFDRLDAFLLGRRTFELMRGYWPEVTDPDDPVAATYRTHPKYVASSTLTDPGWEGSTVLAGDLAAEVTRLKEQGEGELQVHGSATLIRSLHEAGLVDTYRMLQFPVVVGQGKRLFTHPGAAAGLTVTSLEALPDGVVALEADVVRHGDTATGAFAVSPEGREVIR